jgi:hypothetical protein
VAAPRPLRPLPVGGPPPTVIRDLDALFARDPRRASRPSPAPAPAAPPIEPATFAQQLLQKVAADFRPAPAAVTPVAAFAAPPADVNAPRRVAFVPSHVRSFESTAELALSADDEDLAQLVPWYRRLWNKLVGR